MAEALPPAPLFAPLEPEPPFPPVLVAEADTLPASFEALLMEVASAPVPAVPVIDAFEPPSPAVACVLTLRLLKEPFELSELNALPAVPAVPFCTSPPPPPNAV